MKYRLISCMILSGLFCQAETVALWPIDNRPANEINPRCLVSSANNLTGPQGHSPTNAQFAATVPNPDATPALFDNPTNNTGSAFISGSRYYANSGLGWRVDLTNSFTVEGWYLIQGRPAVQPDFDYLVGPRGSLTGGWMLDYRYHADGLMHYNLYVRNGTGPTTVLVNTNFPSVDLTDATGVWHHVALSHAADEAGAGLGVWRLYHNGVPAGTATNTDVATTQNHGNFYLGGRGSNFMDGFLDFWRVSDTALSPEAFLNYPIEIPPQPAQPKTLAYWRLDNLDGSLDLKSYVNSAYNFAAQSTAPLASDGQFASAPPNSDKSADFFGNARTNFGSVCYDASAANRYLRVPSLGLKTDLTNSFTVEGWLLRTANPAAVPAFYYVAGARDTGMGWMLSLRDDGGIRYNLYVNGSQIYVNGYFPGNGGIVPVGEWQHIALTYDHRLADKGVWELFLDGASAGALTNAAPPAASHGYTAFHLGGRPGGNNTFLGNFDCWRVSDAVLAPALFLNAAVDQPLVPRTLAYWKLDAPDGQLDLSSSVDPRFGFLQVNGGAAATNIQARARILNPDTSPDFIGDPAANTGSVFFRAPGAAPNRRCVAASYLGLKLDPANSFTVEGWLRLYDEPDTNDFFYVVGNRRSVNGWMLTLRRDNADEKSLFHLYSTNTDGLNIDRFFELADVAGHRDWLHVALVHDRVGADRGTWELFLDGISRGIHTNNVFARTPFPTFDFMLGGRASGQAANDSTAACFDCWRVTDLPLRPEQFLNKGFPRGTLIRIK